MSNTVRALSKSVTLLGLIILVLTWTGPSLGEDDPTITLVKTLIVREYKGLKISADEYEVEEGDSLSKILQRRQIIDPGPVPASLLNLIKALNPNLINPNLILPGQLLVLPVAPIPDLPEEPAESPDAVAGGTPTAEPQPKETAPPKKERTTEYMVQEGENLAKILRSIGVPDKAIFNEYIDLTLKLNPQLTDPNIIYANQPIILPVPGAWPETTVSLAAAPTPPRPARPTPSPAVTKAPPKPKPLAAPEPPQVVIPAPQLPPAQTLAARAALGLIFSRMGERFVSTGQHFLPLKSGGQITINTQTFPIIETRHGMRIVLDLDRRLPEQMVGLIRSNWSNYIIFRPESAETVPAMLGRLFELCQYYRIYKKGAPWTLRRDVDVRIAADWIVWPDQADWASGHAVVITFPDSKSMGTAPEVADYLARQGIKVIDFYPRGNLIGPEPRRDPSGPEPTVETISSENLEEFLPAVLDLVGQKYERNLSIPLIMSNGEGQDFNFTVVAPLFFTRGGVNYVVAVDGLTQEIRDILEKHLFRVVTHTPGAAPDTMLRNLFQAIQVRTEDGLTIKASTRPDDRNIEIVLRGLLLNLGDRQMLLTAEAVPAELWPLLNRPNLRLVEYRFANPS